MLALNPVKIPPFQTKSTEPDMYIAPVWVTKDAPTLAGRAACPYCPVTVTFPPHLRKFAFTIGNVGNQLFWTGLIRLALVIGKKFWGFYRDCLISSISVSASASWEGVHSECSRDLRKVRSFSTFSLVAVLIVLPLAVTVSLDVVVG